MTQATHVRVVCLADGINVQTDLADIQLPALRAGFAGYPMNPRWNALKFHAWKQGRAWKQALQAGTLTVRPADDRLVAIDEAQSPVRSDACDRATPASARPQATDAAPPARDREPVTRFARPALWLARAFAPN